MFPAKRFANVMITIIRKKFSLVIKSQIPNRPRETPLCTSIDDASLTIEAALAFPVFILLEVFLMCFFLVMHIQLEVSSAMCKTMETLETQAYITERVLPAQTKGQPSNLLSHLLEAGAASIILKRNISDTDIYNYIVGGKAGLQGVMNSEENELSFRVTYKILLPVRLFGKRTISVNERVLGKKWLGFSGDDEDGEQMVYITPNGVAYHKSSACTYLNITIQKVEMVDIMLLRNESGAKYKPCEKCVKGNSLEGSCYITKYGDCYHISPSCSSLSRTIMVISLEKVGDRHPCTKCWKGT